VLGAARSENEWQSCLQVADAPFLFKNDAIFSIGYFRIKQENRHSRPVTCGYTTCLFHPMLHQISRLHQQLQMLFHRMRFAPVTSTTCPFVTRPCPLASSRIASASCKSLTLPKGVTRFLFKNDAIFPRTYIAKSLTIQKGLLAIFPASISIPRRNSNET
jgi:hypothetical protein